VTGQNDPADTRVGRQPAEALAQRREGLLLVDGPQLKQRLVAVADGIQTWWIEERKLLDRSQLQRLGLEDDRGQVAALDLRRCEAVAPLKILLANLPDADACRDG
jgi:hypothetical protein